MSFYMSFLALYSLMLS